MPFIERVIKWRVPSLRKQEILWVDVVKFDALWRGDFVYIEPGGKGSRHGRYQRIGEWIMAGNDVGMPDIAGDEYLASNGTMGFGNGSHRFSWIRDHGCKAMPAIIEEDDCTNIKRLVSTDERVCRVAYKLPP